MKKKSSVIAFRCPPEVTREIDEQCQPLNLSRGDWVRAAILGRLHDANKQLLTDQLHEIHGRLSSVEENIQGVSQNLAKAAVLLLTNGVLGREEAKVLVRRYLIREEGER